MAKREGVALLVPAMSPAELVAKRKAKMSGTPATKPPTDDTETDDTEGSRAAAVSALHQLADAFGVTVKDEDAGVSALEDFIQACQGKYEE